MSNQPSNIVSFGMAAKASTEVKALGKIEAPLADRFARILLGTDDEKRVLVDGQVSDPNFLWFALLTPEERVAFLLLAQEGERAIAAQTGEAANDEVI